MALTEHIVSFARVLRAAGLPVGTDRVLEACRALATVGVARRDDSYWTLAAIFVSRRDQFDVFGQAFEGFWRVREVSSTGVPLPALASTPDAPEELLSRRVAEALASEIPDGLALPEAPRPQRSLSARANDSERLRTLDFAAMSAAEMLEVETAMRQLRLPVPLVATRRYRPALQGPRVDLRATLRLGLRGAPALMPLRRAVRRWRHPPLVVLCDISGSMQRYTRMFLHFLHAVTNDRDRVHVFLFGTRLTNVTRQLRNRDVDVALRAVSGAVADWSGGTRIAASLADFNRHWSRRVLGQNAVGLLITDGLERGDTSDLGLESLRLRQSCHRLLWLNPLLRFSAFEPKAAGVRAILPHVDRFLPAHNLSSLADLARLMAADAHHPS
ncbi:MAG: VWA domain-containing protein [Burkholderiales bacterium]